AHIVPTQCNDMHGLDDDIANVLAHCRGSNNAGRIAHGDAFIGDLVTKLQASPIWSGPRHVAIVITWDENEEHGHASQGCCAADPGRGRIPTIVITNHGPRGIEDPTPYNHYSLLRTTEEAFGINEHLGHANDTHLGVKTMTPLFEVNDPGPGWNPN